MARVCTASALLLLGALGLLLGLCPATTATPLPNAWSSFQVVFSRANLTKLFPYYPPEVVPGMLQFYTSQSLQRDGIVGAWPVLLQNKSNPNPDELVLKLTGPGDLRPFATALKRFFDAGMLAHETWTALSAGRNTTGITFSLDLGMPLVSHQSVQLLHDPVIASVNTSDFLYAATLNRHDALLVTAGMSPGNVARQQRILDICPLTISGTSLDAMLLKQFTPDFGAFTDASLQLMLIPPGRDSEFTRQTLPIIAQGQPVREWLWKRYQEDIKPQLPSQRTSLEVLDLFFLNATDGVRLTPVLVANHPSEYLYNTDVPPSEWHKAKGTYPSPFTVMYQDLVAAGWNTLMAGNSQMDPAKALSTAQAMWSNESLVEAAMYDQNMEYSWYSTSTPINNATST